MMNVIIKFTQMWPMIYRNDTIIHWKILLYNEVCCLLALVIQQFQAKLKKFLHVKSPPATNQLCEIGDPGNNLWGTFQQNTLISSVPVRETVPKAIQECGVRQEIIPQPAPPSEEEGSRRIGEEDNIDITILHDFTQPSMEKATALGSSLVQNQFSVFLPECPELTQLTLKAINRSKVVIALLTPGFINSPNQRNEFSLALIKHSLRVPPLKLLPLIIDLTIRVDQSNLHPVFDRERSFYCLPQGDVNCVAHRGLTRVGDDIEVSERFQFLVQNENGMDLYDHQNHAMKQWIENYNSNLPNDCPIALPDNFIGAANNGQQIQIQFVQP